MTKYLDTDVVELKDGRQGTIIFVHDNKEPVAYDIEFQGASVFTPEFATVREDEIKNLVSRAWKKVRRER